MQGAAPAELLEIVSPAFSVGEELQAVQQTLGSDFDLRAVRAAPRLRGGGGSLDDIRSQQPPWHVLVHVHGVVASVTCRVP